MESAKKLILYYKGGIVSKEDYATALRGHQSAINAIKSPQREIADKYYRDRGMIS